LTVFGVVFNAFLFPRHGGAWVSVATFSVARWFDVEYPSLPVSVEYVTG